MRHVMCKLPEAVRGIGEEVLHAISYGTDLVDWNKSKWLIINRRVFPDTNIIELFRCFTRANTMRMNQTGSTRLWRD